MKVITYMCENCFEPHVFNPSDSNDDDIYICPKCGNSVRATKDVNIACLDCDMQMMKEE